MLASCILLVLPKAWKAHIHGVSRVSWCLPGKWKQWEEVAVSNLNATVGCGYSKRQQKAPYTNSSFKCPGENRYEWGTQSLMKVSFSFGKHQSLLLKMNQVIFSMGVEGKQSKFIQHIYQFTNLTGPITFPISKKLNKNQSYRQPTPLSPSACWPKIRVCLLLFSSSGQEIFGFTHLIFRLISIHTLGQGMWICLTEGSQAVLYWV